MEEVQELLRHEELFNQWDDIAQKEIDETVKKNRGYIKPREDKHIIKARYKKNKENIGNSRHEIIALFYLAFVEKTNGGYFFMAHHDEIKSIIPSITHETALNIACSALAHFMFSDKSIKENIRNFVRKNGIKLESKEKEETLKWLINDKKLSIQMLIIIIRSLEEDFCYRYEITTLQEQVKKLEKF